MNEIILNQQASSIWYVCEKGLEVWGTVFASVIEGRGVGLHDLLKSPPTQKILWFYDLFCMYTNKPALLL